MQKIPLSEQLSLSRLVYGWWRLADWNLSGNHIQRRLEDCLALGISSHDHADIYGDYRCEALFGQALRQAPALRAQIQLVTKCGIKLVSRARPEHRRHGYDTSHGHILRSAEQSLRNLHTDYLDLLLIHRPDPLMDADQVARAFEQLKRDGKVREFGVSNCNASQFALLQSRLPFPLVSNQLEISVLQQQAFLDGSLDQAQQLRRPPMAWSPLGGGALFDAGAAHTQPLRDCLRRIGQPLEAGIDQVALAWLLAHPARILPIVGSQSLTRVQSAAASLDLSLDRDQWFEIWEAGGGLIP